MWGSAGLSPTPPVAQLSPGRPFEVRWGAERLSGTVDFVKAPSGFFGTLGSLKEATLLVEMEPGQQRRHCGIWLSTYGLPAGRVQALQAGLTQMADSVLPLTR